MKRCSECILIDTYPGIEFNGQGVCTYCAGHKKKQYHGEQTLKEILDQQRAKRQPYDAVVGISGGRDSAYVLHYLVRVAKLKVLGFFFDNGLVPETARKNLKNMTDALGVELVVDRSCLLPKCLKNNFEAWIRKPCLSFILLTCAIRNGGIEIGLRKAAKARGVSLIVTGSGGSGTPFQERPCGDGKALGQEKPSFASDGPPLGDSAKSSVFQESAVCLCRGAGFLLPILPWPVLQKVFYSDQTRVDFFDYIEFNEAELHRVIETELKWRKPANVASPWRFDCKLSFLKNWISWNCSTFPKRTTCLAA